VGVFWGRISVGLVGTRVLVTMLWARKIAEAMHIYHVGWVMLIQCLVHIVTVDIEILGLV